LTQSDLFDSRLPVLRRARAHRLGPAAFLDERAGEELSGRLAFVMRPFPVAVDLCSPGAEAMRVLTRGGRMTLRLAPSGVSDPLAAACADAALPPLREASTDLIVSLYGLDLVNDLPGALAQIRRALRPDGLFIAACAGGHTLFELRDCLQRAEAELTGGLSPRVHPFADLREMGGLLQRAGFTLPVADADSVIVRYSSMFALIADLRAMGMTNALTERSKKPASRSLFLRAAELYAAGHADADGRLRATFETFWIAGWAPDDSQQKALRPGSAKARLADALGTREEKLG
jgi:SAM-dependent methyltransferase